jgi:hypothetical protein
MQMKRFKNTTVELNAIRAKMARWTDPICVEYKEEVNKMLEAIGTGHNQEHALTALRSGADSQTQTSFSSPYVADPNMSDTRRQYLESMVTSSKFYMSPK